jgi:very-short-patch-repair endonuclease
MTLERTKQYYDKEYIKNGRSLQDIANECKTYPNKIRRELIKYGFKLRDKSEAQTLALKSGRHKHPTKGKKRSEDIRIKISEKMAQVWKIMDDNERTRRTNLGKQQWEEMSESDKMALQDAALDAIRETTKEGSKLERFLLKNLRQMGYEVLFHSEHILPGTRLQTDLYIPSHKIIIEVDGPSHFYPIWGQENLEKNIIADNRKNGILLTYGFVIIRVKHLAKTISEIHKRRLLDKVMSVLKDVENSFPALQDRLIEVELT